MTDTIHIPPQQTERAAPTEKPPTRRRWFVIGGLLVALVAAAVAVLLMVPSGPAVSSEEAESQLQDVIAEALEGANTTTPVAPEDISVDCPANLPSEQGKLFTCDVEMVVPALGTESATVEAYVAKDETVAYCTLLGEGWLLMSTGDACL